VTKKKKTIQLPEETAKFLKYHGINDSEVYDATDMPTWEYKEMMSLYGYKVAIGVTPCQAYGHSLRSSKGHCVICKPEVLNYRARYNLSGAVYIAYSATSQLVKVGMTKESPNDRIRSLNSSGYGAINDWQLIKSRYCQNMGYVENEIKKKFNSYLKPIEFYRNNSWNIETSTEIFDCNLDDIVKYFLELKE
jgi:hypothetical protein